MRIRNISNILNYVFIFAGMVLIFSGFEITDTSSEFWKLDVSHSKVIEKNDLSKIFTASDNLGQPLVTNLKSVSSKNYVSIKRIKSSQNYPNISNSKYRYSSSETKASNYSGFDDAKLTYLKFLRITKMLC